MGGVSGPTDDSLDRFERVLDQQLAAIEDIDQKAEHVTRFVTLVLGVVLSVASVLSRLDPAAFDPGWASVVAFSMSILGLVGAVAGAILTYQSSRIRIGLHHEAARTVANVNLRRRQYDGMVLRAYADAIEQNRAVLDANATRFRYTLATLFLGVSYLSIVPLLYTVALSGVWKAVVLLLATGAITASTYAILTGMLLTLEAK